MVNVSGALAPDDGYGTNVLVRVAAEVVRQPAVDLPQLAFTGAAVDLQVDLVHHAQARSANRVTETLESAVGLARQGAVVAETTLPHSGFIEVTTPTFGTAAVASATLIEVERPDGARLRLHYRTAPPPLGTVLRAFLESA